jgi:hypothetical protein
VKCDRVVQEKKIEKQQQQQMKLIDESNYCTFTSQQQVN